MSRTVSPKLSRFLYALATAGVLAFTTVTTAPAASPPASPAGLTAIALDGGAALSWRPSTGATSYALYRGTSPTAINTLVTPAGFAGTSFTDSSAANGTNYFYAVRAINGDGQSGTGQLTGVTPRARSCSSGNPVVVENCFPGTTNWKTPNGARMYDGGLDGSLSASSINAGESVELRVGVQWEVPYHVEIYRTGHYGGSQGRLISTIPGLSGVYPPSCYDEVTTTGLFDCANWPVAATISTTTDWPSGVYLLKLVRDDNGNASEVPLVVRDDGNESDVLFGVPTSTYVAYNRFEGKSLYSGLSNPPNTVSGAKRAVKVSFDRPYSQPTNGPDAHDWYSRTDVATVSWLERQGYDTTYIASEDLHAHGGQLTDHEVFVTGAHDEYWSQQMFDAVKAARDAGTSVIFTGANAAYWKIRFEASPVTGRANRVVVGYKTIESGPSDPSGVPTTTWRDPAGPNRPENELIGQMYVGENLGADFPMRVSAQEGRNRFWRYTPLNNLAAGTFSQFGTALLGWEWDARVDNGREPAGVQTLASTPVNGQLIQDNGRFQSPGTTTVNSTLYRAASGALVFSTGTNNWWRGLALNVHGAGEPDARIQQATMNVLADMGVRPATPASGLTVDPIGPPTVTATTPSNGAGGVVPTSALTATFDRELDPGSVDDADMTVTAFDGTVVTGAVTLDNTTRTLTWRATDALEAFTSYTARVTTGVKSWNGDAATAHQWTFSTGPGTPPVVVARTPAVNAVGVPTDAPVTARFDRKLNPASVTASSFSLRPTAGGGAVAATLSYDAATRTARLQPSARLSQSTSYTAELTTGIQANDGTAMSAAVTWSFTTGTNLQVSDRYPAPLASGLAPAVHVRATFSRAADPATVNSSTVRLTGPGGTVVPATVSYEPAARIARLIPNSPLSLLTTYTVTVTGDVHAADGAPLDQSVWTFTTAATTPPSPAATGFAPAAGATEVFNGTTVRASFSLALDPTTVTPQNFTLTPAGGAPVAATVRYDAPTGRAILTPAAPLATGTQYTATLTTGITSMTGAPLTSATSWSFTTANCPCSLMENLTPALTNLPVQDYRPGSGPFSYELGTKITVAEPTQLIALKYYKSSQETGTHVGRVWNASGTQLASVTYANESASGWQRQALATPLTLQPGQTYVVSVGLNAFYSKSESALTQPISSGPLSAPSGANGVYNGTAGQFPTSSWMSSNYFVDAVVKRPASAPRVPGVTTVSPLSGATGVARTARATATFNVPVDQSTVNAFTFTLRESDGDLVPATVTYDAGEQTAILQPQAPLETGETYTARVGTGVESDDQTPMAAPVQWSFTTVPPDPPQVSQVSPVDGASSLSPVGAAIRATFTEPIDTSTLAGFTLTGAGGAAVPASVTYDAPTRTATLTPSGDLSPATTYTARLSTAVESTRGIALTAPVTWQFTTSSCPCRLFDSGAAPVDRNLDVRNYRSGTGPFSLEMGVKVQVTQPARIEAVRFYKDANETGSHVGRVWSSSGTLLATTTFTGESASGWQEQALTAPLQLTPGQTYVVSVGLNSRFGMTAAGLAAERVSGPLRSIADGRNGVWADVAGDFPTNTWGSSNYFVDTVVR
jgi:Domain of unknown function (DUF4082)/Bacterial Ig-like domain